MTAARSAAHAASSGKRAAAPTVTARAAVRAIRDRADACGTSEIRGSVHALARATRRGAGSPRRAAALAAAIDACLARAVEAGPDRWHVAEAATWGLARLARDRRHGVEGAGPRLERLAGEARHASAALGDRDTRPARFVLVLARLFRDVEACRELESAAATAVSEEIARLVTATGTIVSTGSAAVLERLDRWTAVRAAAAELGGPAWDDDVEKSWQAAAANALRLLGTRGRAPAAGGRGRAPTPFVAALASGDAKRARRTARHVARGGTEPTRGGRMLPLDLHDVAAATALVRSGWGRDAVRVLVEYRDATPWLEIALGDRMLVAGPWEWRLEAGSKVIEADGAWTVSCWEADRRAAFLEITAPLAGGLRLERQVVVLRRPRIVLLADAVVPGGGAVRAAESDSALALRTGVPLADALVVEPAGETRELLVYDGAMRCMALPLALPEWRVAGRGGLAADDGRLVLEQAGHRRLYAPLWLDCDPRRIGRPLTWRQLTVADTRRNLPPHQAAGFRVQAGDEQWLLYRALDAARNRTLLGCNVSSGFLLGRIKRSGEVARTVEID